MCPSFYWRNYDKKWTIRCINVIKSLCDPFSPLRLTSVIIFETVISCYVELKNTKLNNKMGTCKSVHICKISWIDEETNVFEIVIVSMKWKRYSACVLKW